MQGKGLYHTTLTIYEKYWQVWQKGGRLLKCDTGLQCTRLRRILIVSIKLDL